MAPNSTDTSLRPVVTRFAPSPTGFMHIGGVRTALFAYLYAKRHRGTFILRIEDTDKEREVPGSIAHIQESLAWLGITPDFGPDTPGPWGSNIQSERLSIYKRYAEELIAKGLAYPDPYTAAEVEAFRAQATAEKRPFLIRNHRPATFEVWDGTKPLRLKVPEVKRYTWHDVVRGELTAGEEALDDVVLIKADGYPTYNFAHIVDDHEMGVTHIMRADEFISSLPKFLSIYDALGLPYPEFVTMPPILRDDRSKKLGKRDGAKDILDYRTEGYLPEAMMNFLALTGWNPGTEQELFTHDELVAAFDATKIQRAGAVVNEDKLLWMNKYHLGKKDEAFKHEYVKNALPEALRSLPTCTEEILTALTPVVLERIHTKVEISDAAREGEYDFAFITPEYDTALLQWKKDPSVLEALPRLKRVFEILSAANVDFSNAEALKELLMPYAEEVGKGEVLWPLRVALSGRAQSPDPFTIMTIIGGGETLKRLSNACGKIQGDAS
ncbi:glutamate--tRNA ligase [Patescibacteria group bacterium]|nr:glutamate--tRNA ligase [Patescibacteria group bacterium]